MALRGAPQKSIFGTQKWYFPDFPFRGLCRGSTGSQFFWTFLWTPKKSLFETLFAIFGPEGPETPVNGSSGFLSNYCTKDSRLPPRIRWKSSDVGVGGRIRTPKGRKVRARWPW